MYSDLLKKALKAKNISFCKIIPIEAPRRMTKEEKISGYADSARGRFEFLEKKSTIIPVENEDGITFYRRNEDYQKAMDDLCMYSSQGKNTTDDGADSIAQLERACAEKAMAQIEIVHIEGGI